MATKVAKLFAGLGIKKEAGWFWRSLPKKWGKNITKSLFIELSSCFFPWLLWVDRQNLPVSTLNKIILRFKPLSITQNSCRSRSKHQRIFLHLFRPHPLSALSTRLLDPIQFQMTGPRRKGLNTGPPGPYSPKVRIMSCSCRKVRPKISQKPFQSVFTPVFLKGHFLII